MFIISDGPAVPSLGILDTDTDSVTIEYRSPELPPVQIETYHLQYRLAGDSSTTWHEVRIVHVCIWQTFKGSYYVPLYKYTNEYYLFLLTKMQSLMLVIIICIQNYTLYALCLRQMKTKLLAATCKIRRTLNNFIIS